MLRLQVERAMGTTSEIEETGSHSANGVCMISATLLPLSSPRVIVKPFFKTLARANCTSVVRLSVGLSSRLRDAPPFETTTICCKAAHY